MSFGPTELIIILVIVLLLFGVGRVSKIGGELGGAVANFRKGLNDGSKKDETADTTTNTADAAPTNPVK
jgi:sec-independent protein translocase protein TatA